MHHRPSVDHLHAKFLGSTFFENCLFDEKKKKGMFDDFQMYKEIETYCDFVT